MQQLPPAVLRHSHADTARTQFSFFSLTSFILCLFFVRVQGAYPKRLTPPSPRPASSPSPFAPPILLLSSHLSPASISAVRWSLRIAILRFRCNSNKHNHRSTNNISITTQQLATQLSAVSTPACTRPEFRGNVISLFLSAQEYHDATGHPINFVRFCCSV